MAQVAVRLCVDQFPSSPTTAKNEESRTVCVESLG
jgi:hypothetical protein